jgi:hypothetical protein
METKYFLTTRPISAVAASSNNQARDIYNSQDYVETKHIPPAHVFTCDGGGGLVLIGGRDSLKALFQGQAFTVAAPQGSRIAVLFSRAATLIPTRDSYTIIQLIAYQPGSALANTLAARPDWLQISGPQPTQVSNQTLLSVLGQRLN